MEKKGENSANMICNVMGLSVFIVLFDTNIQTAIRANCNKMVD